MKHALSQTTNTRGSYKRLFIPFVLVTLEYRDFFLAALLLLYLDAFTRQNYAVRTPSARPSYARGNNEGWSNCTVFLISPLKQTQAANVVQSLFKDQTLNFRVITLREPLKEELIIYLETEHQGGQTLPNISRCARVEVISRSKKGTIDLLEFIVAIDSNDVIKQQHLEGKHSYIDSAYMKEVEAACMADPKVQAEIKTLDLPEGASVIIEPWAYATDGANDMSRRISMVLL
jgi:hypothetical protein